LFIGFLIFFSIDFKTKGRIVMSLSMQGITISIIVGLALLITLFFLK